MKIVGNQAINIFPKGYIPTLDGWRAVAILLVMVAHGGLALLQPLGLGVGSTAHDWTKYGTIGVDIFFGISGLLICSRLLEERDKWGSVSLRAFYIRRACRIFPPYLTVVAAIALLAALSIIPATRQELWACLFFYRNYLPQTLGGWFTGHFWSLAVEEHFYILWPGTLILLAPVRARWFAASLCLGMAIWRPVEFRSDMLSHAVADIAFYGRTDIRLDGLLWGCLAALTLRQWPARLQFWHHAWLSSGLLLAFGACVVLQPPFFLVWQSILVAAMLASTILRPCGALGVLLESQPLVWIGRLSYSLYLWQQLFLIGDHAPVPGKFGHLQQFPLNFVLVFACAWISYRLIEQPMIRLGHSLSLAVTPERRDTKPGSCSAAPLSRAVASSAR